LIFLVGLMVLGGGVPVTAQTASCEGVIIRVPVVSPGLSVMTQPTWASGFTGRSLLVDEHIGVYETHYRPAVGDIWFRVDGGWIQAYSGYTTGVSQVILADFPCAQQLPHTIGE